MINMLIWNIRGISKAIAIHRLRKLIRMHHSSLICILELFLEVDRLESTCIHLGIVHVISSQSGKIWVFWCSILSVEIFKIYITYYIVGLSILFFLNLFLYLMFMKVALFLYGKISEMTLWLLLKFVIVFGLLEEILMLVIPLWDF